MDELESKRINLKEARLTKQQLRVLGLLGKGLSYEEIGEQLVIREGTVQAHVLSIYAKLGIAELPKGQRQRELGLFALALRQLPESKSTSSGDLSKTEQDLLSEPASGFLPNENNADGPPPQALALIRAVSAVVEDERALLVQQDRNRSYKQVGRANNLMQALRRALLLHPAAAVSTIFGVGLLVGVLAVTMLSSATAQVENNNELGKNQAMVGASATDTPLKTDDVVPRASATTMVTGTVEIGMTGSICGESDSITASAESRFARAQGVSIFTTENTQGGVQTNKIRSLALSQQGLWIGYFPPEKPLPDQIGPFLGQYDKATWAICKGVGANHIPTWSVNALVVDKSQHVWAATESTGIAMYDNTTWHFYTTEEGLPSNATFGLTVDQDDNVWAATLEGIAKYDKTRDKWQTIYTAENGTLAYNNTHAIAFDGDGNIWVGHINNGISLYSKEMDRWIHYTAEQRTIGGNKVRSISVQSDATVSDTLGVWIATADGGLSRFTEGTWRVYHVSDGLPSEDVEGLVIDKYKRIWVATLGGVAYFDGRQWVRYHNLSALSIAIGTNCTSCPFEEGEHVWTGTVANGLTHSRLPYAEQAATVTEVCFSSTTLARICQQFSPEDVSDNPQVITATYPGVLEPKQTFQAEIFVAPNPPYKFNAGDMLVTTDDPIVFSNYEHIAVQGAVESAQPYKFADYNVPFIAPDLNEGENEQVFISNWKLWMHTRYAPLQIRIAATIRLDPNKP